MTSSFNGFPEESLTFFRNLQENNTKAWFEANQESYLRYVREPALAFIQELGPRLAQISNVMVDVRTNGSGTLLRVNRDTRFSKNKDPYKTNVSGLFWDGVGKKMEASAFGFQLSADKLELMAGMFQFTKPMLEAYRKAVTDETLGAELLTIVSELQDEYRLEGKHYKKVPAGFDAHPERAELLLYKGLYAFPEPITGEVLYKAELIDLCMNHFEAMAPLQTWLDKVKRNA